jgi:hypothetical protein
LLETYVLHELRAWMNRSGCGGDLARHLETEEGRVEPEERIEGTSSAWYGIWYGDEESDGHT